MTERLPLTSFQDFGLADPILRALTEEQYTTPTPIQTQTIPLAMTGRDVVGIAQTGTGKTAAFALPILHRLIHPRKQVAPKSCRVLVLSPTRELSGQILESFKAYGRHLRLSAALAIGGVPMGRQVRSVMQGVDVMVATPGRLLDLVRGNALRLNQVEFLVLDEADRMLDMGFINDIRKIIAKVPTDRQTLFFSATMPQAIADLAKDMLRNPERVAVTPVASTVERIAQRIIHVDGAAKPAVLAELLSAEQVNRALIFTRTKHGADKVVKGLARAGIKADAIHGNKSQNYRERVLAEFRAGTIRTLVATDIAARGIDVDGVSHVVNFELPNIPETYVHRIGRTARAGAEGTAISLVANGDELTYLRDIEKLIRISLPKEDRRTAGGRNAEHSPSEGTPARHRPHQGGHRQGGHNQGGNGQRNERGPQHARDGVAPHGGRPSDGPNANKAKRRRNRPAFGQNNRFEDGARPEGVRPERPQSDRPVQSTRPDNNRHRPSRPSQNGGESGMQSVAFLRRDSRPAVQPQAQTRRPQR
jgi:superfamily II DNA/RNA helicase